MEIIEEDEPTEETTEESVEESLEEGEEELDTPIILDEDENDEEVIEDEPEEVEETEEEEVIEENIVSETTTPEITTDENTYIFDKSKGIQSVDNVNIELHVLKSEKSSWNLLQINSQIKSLDDGTELNIPKDKSTDLRFGTIIGKDGKRAEFQNIENISTPKEDDIIVQKDANSAFIINHLNTKNNWGIVTNDVAITNLASCDGEITIKAPQALLIGPNNAVLSIIKSSIITIITDDAEKKTDEENDWYSVSKDTKMFEFSVKSEEKEFSGNDEIDTIHVNTGNNTYGWNIAFDNGLNMSLEDVKIYQSKHKKLPYDSGVLSRGKTELKFSNTKRIISYTKTQYTSYGYNK